MRKIIRIIFIIAFEVCAFAGLKIETKAAQNYDTYNFNYWKEAVSQPHAYLFEESINEKNWGMKLSFPGDFVLYKDCFYIADTGNSRILVTELDGKVKKEISYAKDETDKLNAPQGLFVTDEGYLYVADSGNGRILEYDENLNFIKSIGRPVTNLISDSQEYVPTKVVVDKAGRIYVIAYGINMGLVEFNENGEFQGFMGATEVNVSTFTYIWKNYFSTEAQQARMETIVPTEYSNIFVDDEDFVYATINNLSEEDLLNGADAVRRLNPTGTDILRRLSNYEIIGDIDSKSFSSFSDIAATDYGCYFVLDATNGKIFAYDYDGNSLFVFGKKGTKAGNMQNPVAIALDEDENCVYVLDSTLGSILKFEITDYGRHLLGALKLNDEGDSEGANNEWQEVLKANSNNELAYIGLGKTYLNEGRYKEAMDYFKLGNSRKYYTKAFMYYRKEVMEENFSKVMLAIGIVLVATLVIKGVSKFRKWVGDVRCFMEKH